MIKCEKCGKPIFRIITNYFDREGKDFDEAIMIKEVGPENAVELDMDTNWCGYGLTEEEQREHIRCPYCNKFPFTDQEIQVYEYVKVIMFKESKNADKRINKE